MHFISALPKLGLSLAVAAGMTCSAAAQQQQAPLSAQDSDPRVMGWMQGSPPPPDKIITQPDSVYFSFPRLRWSVCHLREFLPTEEISRGLDAPMSLPTSSGVRPAASAAAEPPDEPPGTRSKSYGLLVVP